MSPSFMDWTKSIAEAMFYLIVIAVCTIAGIIVQCAEEGVKLLIKLTQPDK